MTIITKLTKITITTKAFGAVNRFYSQRPDSFSEAIVTANEYFDVVIVGGGIVGAAAARELKKRHLGLKMALVEKESGFAHHQSGHNSGVIHAGIYYKPGSLKAKLCVEGMNLLYPYLDEHKIKYWKCGKLIVATNRSEVPRLLDLYERAKQNEVKDVKLLDKEEIRELEPNCKGIQAIWSRNTGVVDYKTVTEHYVKDFMIAGGKTFTHFEVKNFYNGLHAEYPVLITDDSGRTISTKYVLTCCGLHSDTVALMTGCDENPKIIPIRGEYLYLKQDIKDFVKTNIYPVPDPRFPFLGVHVTPRVDGKIILGPNAVLAFSKEGYNYRDINLRDLKDIVKFSGFRKMALKYCTFGFGEISRSTIKTLQVKQLKRLVTNLRSADCERGPSGVRAQAMGKDGNLIEDFVFDSEPAGGGIGKRVLHCRNTPSPGATSSLAIANMIADKMQDQFNLK